MMSLSSGSAFMGESRIYESTSLSLPPGCRFYPSGEQLVTFYLTHKNNDDRRFPFDVITDLDLYSYDPFDLPEAASFRFGRGGMRRHWYCYTAPVSRVSGGKERKRRAGGGYWRSAGKIREVFAGGAEAGKFVVGTRKSFVFYLDESPGAAVRTNLAMYEYALIGHHKASFVLCRVFLRSCCRNRLVSESVASVRDVGIQREATVLSDINEEIIHDDRTTGIPAPVSMQPNEPVAAPGLEEDDFIELDDLSSPLSGIETVN
ncbi:NAC domain-containing protein 72-like [Diospyros lotus]|uniref:NAC domain-containing protein 72-like n=1 Tax=Diospyros lotus TaxID=55363 RepID=UPI002253B55E|nr:NAC domain-containing protein 72-like [Diospyros lotus]